MRMIHRFLYSLSDKEYNGVQALLIRTSMAKYGLSKVTVSIL